MMKNRIGHQQAPGSSASEAPASTFGREDIVDADTRLVHKKLKRMREGKLSALETSPEMAALLLLPPEEDPHERYVDVLNNIVLLSALILSATLGVGLNPLDVASLPEEHRTIADAYNLLASVLVMVNICTCIWGAYILMQVLSVSKTDMTRVLAHSGPVVVLEFFTFISGWVILVLVCLAIYLKSSRHVAYITVGLNIAIWLAMSMWGTGTIQRAFPISGASWARTFCCELPSSNAKSKRMARYAFAMAEGHLGSDACGDLTEDDARKDAPAALAKVHTEGDGVVISTSTSATHPLDASSPQQPAQYQGLCCDAAAEASDAGTSRHDTSHLAALDGHHAQHHTQHEALDALRAFVHQALEQMASGARIELIARALLHQALTLQVLFETARRTENHHLLFTVLDLEHTDCGILRGERLALANALVINAHQARRQHSPRGQLSRAEEHSQT
jgi:hypothetical protein